MSGLEKLMASQAQFYVFFISISMRAENWRKIRDITLESWQRSTLWVCFKKQTCSKNHERYGNVESSLSKLQQKTSAQINRKFSSPIPLKIFFTHVCTHISSDGARHSVVIITLPHIRHTHNPVSRSKTSHKYISLLLIPRYSMFSPWIFPGDYVCLLTRILLYYTCLFELMHFLFWAVTRWASSCRIFPFSESHESIPSAFPRRSL